LAGLSTERRLLRSYRVIGGRSAWHCEAGSSTAIARSPPAAEGAAIARCDRGRECHLSLRGGLPEGKDDVAIARYDRRPGTADRGPALSRLADCFASPFASRRTMVSQRHDTGCHCEAPKAPWQSPGMTGDGKGRADVRCLVDRAVAAPGPGCAEGHGSQRHGWPRADCFASSLTP